MEVKSKQYSETIKPLLPVTPSAPPLSVIIANTPRTYKRQASITRTQIVIPAVMKYKRCHHFFGICIIVVGGAIILFDPLVPILIRFPFSLIVCSLMMIVSGITSIVGNKKNIRCCLVASMILDVLVCIHVVVGIIVGVIHAVNPKSLSVKAYGGFLTIYSLCILFIVIVDSSLKCADICLKRNQPQTVVTTSVTHIAHVWFVFVFFQNIWSNEHKRTKIKEMEKKENITLLISKGVVFKFRAPSTSISVA